MKVLFLTLILCINAGAAAVSAPHGNGVANEKVNVPIWAEQLDGVIEYGFKIAYDPNILAPVDDGCTTYLTMAYQMTSVCTIERVGRLRASAFGGSPLYGNGVILIVTFRAIHSGTSPIDFKTGEMFTNSGSVPVTFYNGSVTVE